MTGDARVAWAFLACGLAAVAAYAGGVYGLSRRPAGLGAVAAVAVGLQLAPLCAPLLLSTDAWTYWAYGRVAVAHDGNPYRDPPARFPDDPATRFAGAAWRDSTSVYGPAFTLASEPLALAVGRSADGAAWAYKGLAAAGVLGSAALAARLARRRVLALALVGWNPLLALHFAGGGHNDAWMAVLVMAALALASSRRPTLAGAAWALAALVKWIPLMLLPLRALEARATGRAVSHSGFAVAALAVVAVATWRYGSAWLGAFGPLTRNAGLETEFALPHRLGQLGVPAWLSLTVALAAFAAAYGWLLRSAAHGRARLGLAAGLLLLATPYLAPWYLIWALPLAAAEDDETAQWLAVALTVYLLPQTISV